MGPGGPRALWEMEGEMKALQSGQPSAEGLFKASLGLKPADTALLGLQKQQEG